MFGFKIIFWYWWALAAVLLVFEMMLPGVVFLFLAIGALASGAFLLVVSDLSLELQLLCLRSSRSPRRSCCARP